MDRSVTNLVESGIELPWWWVYGRRFDSKEKAPNSRSLLSCDYLSDVLPQQFAVANRRLGEKRAREESLRKHREKYGSRTNRSEPSKSVIESWQRIEGWYAENANSLTNSLAPGATQAAIERFEKEIGAKLPDDFKESVRVHDGGGWWVPWRHGDLLSLEGILEQWKMYSDWQAKGNYATGEDWVPRDIKGPIKPVFWNKQRIYLTDNSGHRLTLDLDPPADGKYGQVLDHCHEVGPTEVVASGWAEFLRMLVDDLESGKYVYLEDGGVELAAEVEKELAEGL
jgi:cell wall assembly regulator SMI1